MRSVLPEGGSRCSSILVQQLKKKHSQPVSCGTATLMLTNNDVLDLNPGKHQSVKHHQTSSIINQTSSVNRRLSPVPAISSQQKHKKSKQLGILKRNGLNQASLNYY